MTDQITDDAATRVEAFLNDWDAVYSLDVTGVLAAFPASHDNGRTPTLELMKADIRQLLAERDAAAELIGPLTVVEWCSLRLTEGDEDLLYCCAVTSEFRSALFHVMRMGGDFIDGHWTLAQPWRALVAYHGDDIATAQILDKIRVFYKLDDADDVLVGSHPASVRSSQPHDRADVERLLVDNADLRADNTYLRQYISDQQAEAKEAD